MNIIHEEADTMIIRQTLMMPISSCCYAFQFQWYYQRSSKDGFSDRRSLHDKHRWQCLQSLRCYEQPVTSTQTYRR